ncbi:MAG TPA: ribonuclease HII, partial [Candidatus Sumerlaeota bacterium]|nr:ribonuclease HII [Candidatus Sumerlaeota bacterium]
VDRYANLEVNFLLQRMEVHDGISILTTNLGTGIDQAFKRRLRFRLHFDLPGPEEREKLFPKIMRMAVSCGIGIATAQEIDLHNILEATRLAVRRALAMLEPQPGALVTDALTLPGDERPTLPLVKGDAICASISAASILAKVTRDRMMEAYAEEFPQYGWERNRGYPTADHYAALAEHGPTILHRMTFQGVGFFAEQPRRSPTFLSIRERLVSITVEHEGETRESWRRTLAETEHRLPPPDLQELQMLIEERLAKKGL